MNQNNKSRVQPPTILMVIAFNGFKDEEYFVPKQIFEAAGLEVVTASTKQGTAHGADGGETEVQFNVETHSYASLQEFSAVVFIGGPGMAKQLDNTEFQQLAQAAASQNKIVAAICIAPAILARAGVLQGKQATVWSSPLDKSAVKTLEENGASYQDQPVVQDGKLITAHGPAAARQFAETIVKEISTLL